MDCTRSLIASVAGRASKGVCQPVMPATVSDAWAALVIACLNWSSHRAKLKSMATEENEDVEACCEKVDNLVFGTDVLSPAPVVIGSVVEASS